MNLLLRSQLRFVARSPWSALAALLGVVLGVTSVVAVHEIGTRVERSLDRVVPPYLAYASHVAERPGMNADDYFALRRAWRAGAVPGISAMAPLVEGQVLASDPDGGAARDADSSRVLRIVGVDWLSLPGALGNRAGAGVAPVTTPGAAGANGSALATATIAALLRSDTVLADRSLGLPRGARIAVDGASYEVVGVVDGQSGVLYADIGVAQRLLGLSADAVSMVVLASEDPWRSWRVLLDRLMPGLSAGLAAGSAPALPGGTAGWRVRALAQELPSAAFARSVLFNLGALGTLSLLVAWFLIYQVAVIWLHRQRSVLERLDVLGATTAELALGFVAVFVLLGLAATAVGLALGLRLAALLAQAQGAALASAEQGGGFDGVVLGKALVSGLGVCLLGACAAFLRDRDRLHAPRWLAGAVRVLAALGLVLGLGLERSGLAGGMLAVLCATVLALSLVNPLLRLLRIPGVRGAGEPRGLLLRAGLRDLHWYPRVLNVALGALALAIAVSLGVALMVASFRSDFTGMLAQRLDGDFYIRGDVAGLAAAAQWLQGRPEVRRVRSYGSAAQRADGLPVDLGYARFDTAEAARYGVAAALPVGAALISERLARTLHLAIGETLEIAGRRLTVAQTFPGYGDARPRVLVDVATARELGVTLQFDRLTVDLWPAQSQQAAAGLAARLQQTFPQLDVQSQRALRAQALAIFEQTFAVTGALTLLALVVALFGIYAALTALRLIQAPVLRLLESQGVSGRELLGVTLIRSAATGAMALLIALPLGIAMAWMLCHVINPRAFGWTLNLSITPGALLPPLLGGLAAAVMAGVLPAPRERGVHDAAP
ncbi:MAG: FtsX-like permease family protein [Pseudomonadales bacterium]